jgi:hypothetical protein
VTAGLRAPHPRRRSTSRQATVRETPNAEARRGCRGSRSAGTLESMTELLEDALRKVASLPKEEQDAIAAQIIETLQDETAWKEKLARTPEKLARLAQEARAEHERGETRALDELL